MLTFNALLFPLGFFGFVAADLHPSVLFDPPRSHAFIPFCPSVASPRLGELPHESGFRAGSDALHSSFLSKENVWFKAFLIESFLPHLAYAPLHPTYPVLSAHFSALSRLWHHVKCLFRSTFFDPLFPFPKRTFWIDFPLAFPPPSSSPPAPVRSAVVAKGSLFLSISRPPQLAQTSCRQIATWIDGFYHFFFLPTSSGHPSVPNGAFVPLFIF